MKRWLATMLVLGAIASGLRAQPILYPPVGEPLPAPHAVMPPETTAPTPFEQPVVVPEKRAATVLPMMNPPPPPVLLMAPKSCVKECCSPHVLINPPPPERSKFHDRPVIIDFGENNEQCDQASRFWFSSDAMYWWQKGDRPPVLVTSAVPGTPQPQAGLLDQRTTIILNPLSDINDGGRPGFKFGLGYWLTSNQKAGIQIGGFGLADETTDFHVESDATGNPILARPFVNAPGGDANARQVAFPGLFSGSVDVHERSSLSGVDFALRGNVCCGCSWRLDALIGYRYINLADHLRIRENQTLLSKDADPPLPVGTRIQVEDRFDTKNAFHGLDVGTILEYRRDRLNLRFLTKVAFGYSDEGVNINGFTRTIQPNGTATDNGGLLALKSNIGEHRRSPAQLVPELGFNLGYQVTDNILVRGGYSFIYLDHVIRAGREIDPNVNPNFIQNFAEQGPNNPAVLFNERDHWIHGISLGVEFRF